MDLFRNSWDLILTLVIALLLAKLIKSIISWARMVNLVKDIPGPPSLPLVGNALVFVRRPNQLANIFLEWYASYGGVFKVWLGTRLYIVLASSKHVEKLLSSSEFVDKNTDYEMLHEWIGQGVATVNGDKWFKRRKMLNKAFFFNRLKYFCDVVNEQSKILLDVLEEEGASKKEMDMSLPLAKCVMDILAETGMNTKLESQKSTTNKYFEASVRVSEILYQKMLQPWLCFPLVSNLFAIRHEEQKCYEILHSFTDKIIAERKQQRLNSTSDNLNGVKNLGFLDLLLDAQENDAGISDLEIRHEIGTFMFGGQDTVSTNLTWVVRMISIHVEIQKKLQEELNDIFEDRKPVKITLDDISKMKYMECVIKETLRLCPSGPIFNRMLKKDVQLENGFWLPKGASAQIHAFLLHRDPEIFPNPEVFDPDRFLPERSTNPDRDPYGYVPFSGGPRNCIGQKFALVQEKIILAHLLTRYNIEAANGMVKVEFQWDLVLRPKDGACVKLTQRL